MRFLDLSTIECYDLVNEVSCSFFFNAELGGSLSESFCLAPSIEVAVVCLFTVVLG
jgi:hypothetical protein